MAYTPNPVVVNNYKISGDYRIDALIVVGFPPSVADKALYVGMLERSEQTVASLGVLAADISLNTSKVDAVLVGLALQGLPYTPV
jgi:hypothetical protein